MAVTFSTAIGTRPVRMFQIGVVAAVLLALILDGMDSQLLGLVAPLVIAEWGIERAQFGWALSAAIFGMAIGASIGGWAGDRFGRLNTVFVSALVFGAATIAASLTHGVASLTFLRVLAGIGFGAIGPSAVALASEWTPERWRTYVIALLSIGTPAGGTVVAGIAPFLLASYGWRGAFVILGACAILVGLLARGVARESPSYLLAHGDADRAQRAARRVLDDEFELVPEDAQLVVGADADAGIGVFDPGIARLVWGTSLALGAESLVVYAVTSWWTVLFTSHGFSQQQAINSVFWAGLASVAGALAAGYFARAFGTKRVLLACSALTLLSVAGLAAVTEMSAGAPSAVTLASVYGLTCGLGFSGSLAISATYAMMALGFPVSCRSTGIGFGMMIGRVGGIVMSFFGGYLLDLGAGSTLPFFGFVAVFALVFGACAWIVDRHIEPARA